MCADCKKLIEDASFRSGGDMTFKCYCWTVIGDPILIFVRSSHPEVFLGKSVLKICSKFTGEHPCRNVISISIALRHGCSPVNLLHFFRTSFLKNTSGRLLLICAFRRRLDGTLTYETEKTLVDNENYNDYSIYPLNDYLKFLPIVTFLFLEIIHYTHI